MKNRKVVDAVAQGDIIKTIEITGDFDKFLTEENKKMTEQMDEACLMLNSQI